MQWVDWKPNNSKTFDDTMVEMDQCYDDGFMIKDSSSASQMDEEKSLVLLFSEKSPIFRNSRLAQYDEVDALK